jgi:hypothetical protein
MNPQYNARTEGYYCCVGPKRTEEEKEKAKKNLGASCNM